jgi:hypothetical protein
MQALTVTGAAFAGIGALLFAIGVVITRSNRAFARRALRAPGQVTGVRRSSPAGATTTIAYPELRFALPDGRLVETVARTGTNFERLQEGDAVTVLYDPADPTKARVDSRKASAGATLLGAGFLVIGGVFVLLGLALAAAGVAFDDALPGG